MTDGGCFGLFADSENLEFYKVELYLPAFLPVKTPVKIVLQTLCVCLVVNGEVCYNVVCKEAHVGNEVLGRVIDVEKKQAWSEHWALGDSWWGLLMWPARACSSPHRRPPPGYGWPGSSWSSSGCVPLSRDWQSSSASACDRLCPKALLKSITSTSLWWPAWQLLVRSCRKSTSCVWHESMLLTPCYSGYSMLCWAAWSMMCLVMTCSKQFAADAGKVYGAVVGCQDLIAFFKSRWHIGVTPVARHYTWSVGSLKDFSEPRSYGGGQFFEDLGLKHVWAACFAWVKSL